MTSLILILAAALGVVVLTTVFVIALGITAARADEDLDRQLAERRRRPPLPDACLPDSPESYTGLAWAQATISGDPSTTVSSSRTSVGTMRFPVRRSTS